MIGFNSLKDFDNSFISSNINLIAGIDEAGRGPIAGPVVAAAVVYNEHIFHPQINDSKKLSEKNRNVLFEWIINNCICYSVSIVSQIEIDKINILQATLKSMKLAAENLHIKPGIILIDGNKSFTLDNKGHVKTFIKGDTKSFAIASASIVAKVIRDKIMIEAAQLHPEYLWDRNKGYPTRYHIDAVKKFGITPFHRKSFLRKIFTH